MTQSSSQWSMVRGSKRTLPYQRKNITAMLKTISKQLKEEVQ